LFSCEEKAEYRLYLVHVDSVAVPKTIAANNSFDIEFYGLLGINSCSEFSHLETNKSSNEILIECWGKDYSVSDPCMDVLTSLGNQKLSYLIEEPGNYLIKLKQPYGDYIETEIVLQ